MVAIAEARAAGGSAAVAVLALCLTVVAGACTEPAAPAAPDAGQAQLRRRPAPKDVELHPARRCAECHASQYAGWQRSAHADAARSAFARSLEHVPQQARERCEGCHLPLATFSRRVAGEGVACNACHTALARAPPPEMIELVPERAVKFGPFRDSKPHYFHKVAFSEFVSSAELCLSCHDDRETGPFPVFTSGAEWRAEDGSDCQSCHMLGQRGEAARGAGRRSISDHDFGADKAKALAEGLELTLAVAGTPSQATATLTNAYADHYLPTDLPERRLHLKVQALGEKGEVLAQRDHPFGRWLEDGQGAPAPFFLAVRARRDHRLPPGGQHQERLPLPPGTVEVRAEVWYERHDDAFDRFYGPTEPLLIHRRQKTR